MWPPQVSTAAVQLWYIEMISMFISLLEICSHVSVMTAATCITVQGLYFIQLSHLWRTVPTFSFGFKSQEQCGCSENLMLFCIKNCHGAVAVWCWALSCWKIVFGSLSKNGTIRSCRSWSIYLSLPQAVPIFCEMTGQRCWLMLVMPQIRMLALLHKLHSRMLPSMKHCSGVFRSALSHHQDQYRTCSHHWGGPFSTVDLAC